MGFKNIKNEKKRGVSVFLSGLLFSMRPKKRNFTPVWAKARYT